MGNPRKVFAEINRKMNSKDSLTERDLSELADAVRKSGRMEDKILYVGAKSYREQQAADREPTADEIKAGLVEAVDLTWKRASQSSNPNDILRYVEAKAALSEHGDGGDGEEETE